jgi:hypothetical protein
MRKLREERGADKRSKKPMSVYAVHKRKTVIIRKVNEFLSERSELKRMIVEINERGPTDLYYISEIVSALREAKGRINATIEALNITVPVE